MGAVTGPRGAALKTSIAFIYLTPATVLW